MSRLIRAFDRDIEVLGLLLGELGEFDANLVEVETGDFLVEPLGQHIDTRLVGLTVLPELKLGEGLVAEASAHDEARVTCCAAEIH